MRRMNASAELEHKTFAGVAAEFLAGTLRDRAQAGADPAVAAGFWHKLLGPDLGRLTREHLALVFLSLAGSVVVGVPLGMLAARFAAAGAIIMGVTGVLQTIPSLALLAILIPLTGSIGLVPAFIALAVYAPAHRAQYPRRADPDSTRHDAGRAGPGLDAVVDAAPDRTAAGAPHHRGGHRDLRPSSMSAPPRLPPSSVRAAFGERIVTGLALNDNATLLAGAIPVALLALAIEAAFTLGERGLTPAALPPDRAAMTWRHFQRAECRLQAAGPPQLAGHAIHRIDRPDTSITASISCRKRCSGRCSTRRLDRVEPVSTKTPISRPWAMARLSITPSW